MNTSLRDGARRLRAVAGSLSLCLLLGACGSTLSNAELNAQARESFKPASGPAAQLSDTAGSQNVNPTAEASNTTPTQGSDQPAGQPAASAVGPSGAVAPSAPNRAIVVGSARSAAPTSASTSSVSTPAGPNVRPGAQPGQAVPDPAPAAGGKAAIALGVIGIDTGPIGAAAAPMVQGARAWAADVNARGGLNGHPIRLVIADDQGDPNKALALAHRMVDQDHVLAFFAEHGPGTHQVLLPFLEQRGIPSLAPCYCSADNGKSPMSFQIGFGSTYGIAWAHVLPLLAFSEKRKISIMYCREVAVCKGVRDRVVELSAKAGLQIVHEAQTSVAQPDFTGEILAAESAGAEAIVSASDPNSTIRLARSAHRQKYTGLITTQSQDARTLSDGARDVEGRLLLGGSVPNFESPKLADYRAALARYVPGGIKGDLSGMPWIMGKLLEKIAPSLPARPTSADLLKGLYALNGETLDGLMAPLSYRVGEGHDKSNWCVFPLRIEQGRFVTKDGDNYTCAPGWAPVKK